MVPHGRAAEAATTIAEIEDYPWPDMHDPTRVAHVRAQAAALAEANEYAILATPWLLFPFERAIAMQGMETFLMNMAMYPDFAVALLWRIEELCKELMGHFLEELGDNVDIIKIGDDLGTQESLLMSPPCIAACSSPCMPTTSSSSGRAPTPRSSSIPMAMSFP